MLRALSTFGAACVYAVCASAAPPPQCFEAAGENPTGFEFQVSKADEVSPGEIDIKRSDAQGLDFTSSVSPATIVETSGRKKSQRSELRETVQSSSITRGLDWQCYAFSLMVPEDTALPRKERDGKRAKLTVAQFHQERTGSVPPSAVIFFDVDPRGHLLFEFSERLGAKRKILTKNVRGRWLDVRIAARWSTKRREGRTLVWVRERGEEAFESVIDVKGRNSTTGHVYQKLGAYRSFIERDKEFAETAVQVHYSNISRNGRPATFR